MYFEDSHTLSTLRLSVIILDKIFLIAPFQSEHHASIKNLVGAKRNSRLELYLGRGGKTFPHITFAPQPRAFTSL